MALIKTSLQQEIYEGLRKVFLQQVDKASSGDEDENPSDVVNQIAKDMASVISDAIDSYVKSGDIMVGPSNILVTSTAPGNPAKVTSASPAKMK